MTQGPVLIDLEDAAPGPSVADAPPVPEQTDAPTGQAMQAAATLAAQRPSRLARWFWGATIALLGAMISVSFWDFAASLVTRVPLLGYAVVGLAAALLVLLAILSLREVRAILRLGRIDGLRRTAESARADADLEQARKVSARLVSLYSGRAETRWGRNSLEASISDQFDADAVLDLTERSILVPLDEAASREVEAAARRVATVTALVPLALVDVFTALAANLRMIRRIAEIYGGHAGVIGSWRLTRAVFTHLAATGAVAIGDDLVESVLGGSLLSKLSRRFGEGLLNGALTARVGVAAMELCRPLPFSDAHKPSVRGLVKHALAGLFRSQS